MRRTLSPANALRRIAAVTRAGGAALGVNLFSLAGRGIARLIARFTFRFTARLDSQDAAPSFRGDMARDEFFLPNLLGARERALFLSARTRKDDSHVRLG
jgi:hypothetical protein